MKKLILLFTILLAVLLITACDTNNNTITPQPDPGNIYVTSNPAGAQIWLDGVNTAQVTPDTIKNLDEDVYNVTLKLTDYNDATFSVSVISGQTSDLTNIVLVSNLMKTLFGPVKIYESFGATSSEPSGLDLSSGKAWGVSSDSSGLVDICTSFLVQSADLNSNLIRETDFRVGPGSNLFDGEDSPDKNAGTWTNNISSTESNYVFLYDHDGHFGRRRTR